MSDAEALAAFVTLERYRARLVAEEVVRAVPEPTIEDDAPGLVAKTDLAKALGVSVATVDRFVREKMPVEHVGARRRFDIAACRTWLAARGRRPALVVVRDAKADNIDVTDIAARAGLRGAR